MNIIIDNDFSLLLGRSNIPSIKHITGMFSVDELKEQLQNMYFDKMILDISALKDADKLDTIKKLSSTFEMTKVIVLINKNPVYNTSEYLSMLISFGIYNFTRNIDGVKILMNKSNTYKDVAQYHIVKDDTMNSNTSVIEKALSNTAGHDFKQEMEKAKMQEVVKQAANDNNREIVVSGSKDAIYQLVLGFVLMPILVIILSLIYYYGYLTLDQLASYVNSVHDVMFYRIFNGSVNPAMIVLVLIVILFLNITYEKIDHRVLYNKKSCLKYLLVSFSVLTILLFGQYYMLEVPFSLGEVSSDLIMNIGVFSIIVYYLRLLTYSLNDVEYQHDASQRLNIVELVGFLLIIVLISIYGLLFICNLFITQEFFSSIYSNLISHTNVFNILVIVLVPITIVISVMNFLRKEKKLAKIS